MHIDFTVSGYEVAPAAEGLKDKSGHFHLIVDAEDFIEEGIAIKVWRFFSSRDPHRPRGSACGHAMPVPLRASGTVDDCESAVL